VTQAKILYFTDRYKVSRGYEPAFTRMLNKSGIHRNQVFVTDIYGLVDTPLIRKGNEKTWRFNPDRKQQIRAAFDLRINAIKPTLLVVSDPAVLGVLVNWDWNLATLDKCRGGVYYYRDIPVVVVYPITVIHTHFDESLVHGEDEDNKQEPYRVKSGAWILQRDWEKVGRYVHGKQRRIPEFNYSICRTLDDCYAAREWLLGCDIISTDTETGTYPAQITCVGFTGLKKSGACRTFVFPFYDPFKEGGVYWDSPDDHAIAWSIVRDINDSPILKVMQNGQYDCSYFVKYRIPPSNFLIDSMLLWYALYMELPKSLDFIASILLDNFQYWKDDIKGIDNEKEGSRNTTSLETYWRYNGLDCYNTLFSALYLIQLLPNNPAMRRNYADVFMRMLCGFRMSMRGVRADFKRREEHRVTLERERDEAQKRLRYILAEPEFNINSPQQKADLLYNVFGLPPRNARGRFVDKNKPLRGTNAISAGAIPIKMAKSEHPIFRYVLEILESAMEPDKQISNVCNMKLFTDRFRTTYNAAGTGTTRYSSKTSNFWDGGNAQNIRETMRDWLVADEGCILLDVDYSQSDDVFVAYESNDPDKIALIQSGRDGHAVHGEMFFKRPYEYIIAGKKSNDPIITHPLTGIRQISKKIVHGGNFQMSPPTLYMLMGREAVVATAEYLGFADASTWKQDQLINVCGRLLNAYRAKYRRLSRKEWYGDIAKELKTKGIIQNCFGVTRRFLGDPDDNGTQREATAYYGQSGTAGNMNRSQYEIDLGYIPESFRDGPNPDARKQPLKMDWDSHGFAFLLQTHDSFTAQLNTRHPKWKEAALNLLHVMSRPCIINGHVVRVRVEAQFGQRWSKNDMIEWKSLDPYDLDRIAA
jgi:hypothetical protein